MWSCTAHYKMLLFYAKKIVSSPYDTEYTNQSVTVCDFLVCTIVMCSHAIRSLFANVRSLTPPKKLS